MPVGAVRIEGLRELQVSLQRMRSEVGPELRKELRDAGEPVRALAEEKAVGRIRNIGPQWSRMRLGVTTKVVYVAPKSRRHGGSPRPNLGGLLMDRAMQPALDESAAEIYPRVEAMLDRLGAEHGF
jgi:hypothetical protein